MTDLTEYKRESLNSLQLPDTRVTDSDTGSRRLECTHGLG